MEGISRRDFLKLGGLAGVSALAAYYGLDREASGGLSAAIARSKEGFKLSGEKHEPSEKAIKDTWDKHFSGKANNFMTLDSWKVIGKSMSILANVSFNATEQKGDFDQYFAYYIDEMAEACEIADLDLEIFTISLDYPASTLIADIQDYRDDIVISSAQQLLGPITRDLNIQDSISEEVGVKTLGLPINYGQIPLTYGRAAQLLSANVTTGIMEYEITRKASDILDNRNQRIGDEIAGLYPEVINNFRLVDAFAIKREVERWNLARTIDDNLNTFTSLLSGFFQSDSQNILFETIGIGEELDVWQKIHPTRVWHHVYYLNHKTDQEIAADVKLQYNALYQSSPEIAARSLVREQIMNPKFLNFLEKSEIDKDLLKELKNIIRKLDNSKSNLIETLYKAQEVEAPYEFDPKYQCLTAAAMVKSMINKVEGSIGPFGKKSKDEVALFSYAMQFIKESSPPQYLLNSRIGLDLRVDSPYEIDLIMYGFGDFVERIESFTGKKLKNDIRWVDPDELLKINAPQDLIALAEGWAWFNLVNKGTIRYYFETKDELIRPAPWDNY